MPRKKKSDVQQTNMVLIAIVLALVIFGLGYVFGRAKTRLAVYKDVINWRSDMMHDSQGREQFVEYMLKNDETRDYLYNVVDEHREEMEQMMR